MAYTLWKFGSIELPPYNRSTKMTPVRPRTALVATAAGVFDAWGSGRAQAKFPHSITLKCVLAADDAATWRSSIDALRAAVGTRALLYRRADDDGTVNKCTARLMDMNYSRVGRRALHQELTLAFEQLDRWGGKQWADWTLDDGHFLDDGYFLDTGAISLYPDTSPEVTVGGNLPATSPIFTIEMAGTDTDPISVVIPATGVALNVDGPWADGDVLIIDSDARLITFNGADAYDRLDLDTGYGAYDHTANEWLAITPGTYAIFVIGAAIEAAEMTYTEAWA